MAKVNVNSINLEEESAGYEKFTKSNRKKNSYEEDIFQSQGKLGRERKGDSYISQRTKSRT